MNLSASPRRRGYAPLPYLSCRSSILAPTRRVIHRNAICGIAIYRAGRFNARSALNGAGYAAAGSRALAEWRVEDFRRRGSCQQAGHCSCQQAGHYVGRRYALSPNISACASFSERGNMCERASDNAGLIIRQRAPGNGRSRSAVPFCHQKKSQLTSSRVTEPAAHRMVEVILQTRICS